MNRLLAFAVMGVASAVVAQVPVQPPDSQVRAAPVSSPNRATSAQLAAKRPSVAAGIGAGSAAAAPVWVDSEDNDVGRAYSIDCRPQAEGGCFALTTYNDRPLGIKLAAPDAESAGVTLNGVSSASGLVFYTSADCSGRAYLWHNPEFAGFPQVGVSVLESDSGKSGRHYVYIADQTTLGSQPVTIASEFANGQCYVLDTPQQWPAFPVIAVVPASTFAAAGALWIK